MKKNGFNVHYQDAQETVPDKDAKHELFNGTGAKLKALFKSRFPATRLRIGNELFGKDTIIRLENIHKELGEADAFVFLPSRDVDQDLKFFSAFVGVQTGDKNMFTTKMGVEERQKPLITVGKYGWSQPVLDLIKNTGFISDPHKHNIVMHIDNEHPEQIVAAIELILDRKKQERKLHHDPHASNDDIPVAANDDDATKLSDRKEPKFKICVFCSASYRYSTEIGAADVNVADEHNLAFQLGAALARAGYGVVSGAGRFNMMGDTVRGAQSVTDEEGQPGWTAGSNTPHIRELEKLPKNLDAYVDMPDIYLRMKVMIEGSDGFIIAPGGAGSIQEFMTLMHYKKRGDPLMNGKPVVILNPKDKNGEGYWDALVAYAKHRGLEGMFKVASTAEEAQQMIVEEIKAMPKALSTSWHELVEKQKRAAEPDFTIAV